MSTPIPYTELKLQEAEYYLQRMRDTASHSIQQYFQFELDSFLVHARSVTSLPVLDRRGKMPDTGFLEQELGANAQFEAWYVQKAQNLQSDAMMNFMRKQRNIVIHCKGTTIHMKVNNLFSAVEHLPISSSLRTELVNMQDGTKTVQEVSSEPLPTKPTESTFSRVWYFDTNDLQGDTEVFSVCEAYIAQLERLVDECRQCGF